MEIIQGIQYGATRLVEINAGVQLNEKVLIICDTSDNYKIAQALASAVKNAGGEYTIAFMEPRTTHGEDPTKVIANAMLEVDVVFAPTRFSLSHSDARIKANERGVRFISMPDYTMDMMMEGGALGADFLEIYHTVEKMRTILSQSEKIHITTKAGTDITLSAKGRVGNEVSGVCRTPGTWGSPPNIEVNVSPIEHLSNGTVVVDGSIPMPEIGLIKEKIELTIEDGRIVKFSEGEQAEIFKRLLRGSENSANLVLAEFGMGLNNKAILKGSMLEDEGAYGTCHFGFGHNADQGGTNEASVHIDAVYCKPNVEIDGKLIVKQGKLLI